MNAKQALERWLSRHATTPNRILHAVGIPVAVLGVIAIFLAIWWLAAIGLLLGYVMQVVGHLLEGTEVGEVMLLRKIVFPSGGFVRRWLIISLVLAVILGLGLLIQSLLSNGP